jgi:hypothetical protein
MKKRKNFFRTKQIVKRKSNKRKTKKRKTNKRKTKKRINKKYKQRGGGAYEYKSFIVECDSDDIYSNQGVQMMLHNFEKIYQVMKDGGSINFDKGLFDNFVEYIRSFQVAGNLPALIKSDHRYLKWLYESSITSWMYQPILDNFKRLSENDLLNAQNCGHRAYFVCQQLEQIYGNRDIFSGVVTIFNSDVSKLRVPHSSNPKIFAFCEKDEFIYFVDFASVPPHIIIDRGSIDVDKSRTKLMEPYGITDIQNITWRTYYDIINNVYTGLLNPSDLSLYKDTDMGMTQSISVPDPVPTPSQPQPQVGNPSITDLETFSVVTEEDIEYLLDYKDEELKQGMKEYNVAPTIQTKIMGEINKLREER